MKLSAEEHAEQAELLLREVEQDTPMANTDQMLRALVMVVSANAHATLATVFDE